MIIPTVIEKEHSSERVYDLYSRLLKDRIIFLSGEITDEVANVVVGELLFLNSQSKEDIYLYINSPGGSVTAGMAIYDTINFIEADVSTICVGMCASMAAFLLSSGTKGKRVCLKNGEVMIHQPLGGAQGQQTDIEIASEHIKRTRAILEDLLIERSNGKLTDKNIKENTERDNYLTPQQALDLGIIDEIIQS